MSRRWTSLRMDCASHCGADLMRRRPRSWPTCRSPGALRERPERIGTRPLARSDVAVVAPLTGVFYLASSPSVPPFVEVGSPVQAGEVVCIIEAMKVFNEISCEIAGMVSAIIAQNGQLVQRGDALIRIKPL